MWSKVDQNQYLELVYTSQSTHKRCTLCCHHVWACCRHAGTKPYPFLFRLLSPSLRVPIAVGVCWCYYLRGILLLRPTFWLTPLWLSTPIAWQMPLLGWRRHPGPGNSPLWANPLALHPVLLTTSKRCRDVAPYPVGPCPLLGGPGRYCTRQEGYRQTSDTPTAHAPASTPLTGAPT